MELRRRMGELLDMASAGEHILVERGRRPLAVLVPYEDALRLEESPDAARARALAALDRLDEFVRKMARAHPDSEPGSAELLADERSRGHGTDG